jgi:hypothetical protein
MIEGEGRLLGLLGANATLGGVRVLADTWHIRLMKLMPLCADVLVLIQVAIGIATLVYMLLKIRKILQKSKHK